MKNLLPKFKSFSLEDYPSISTFNIEKTFTQDIRPTLSKLYSQDELLQLDPPPEKLRKRKPRRNKEISVGGASEVIEVSPLSEVERGLAEKPMIVLPDASIAPPSQFYYDHNRQRIDNFRITIDNELTVDTDLILQRAGSIYTSILASRTRYTRSMICSIRVSFSYLNIL